MEAQLVQTLRATLEPAAETRRSGEQALEHALDNPGQSCLDRESSTGQAAAPRGSRDSPLMPRARSLRSFMARTLTPWLSSRRAQRSEPPLHGSSWLRRSSRPSGRRPASSSRSSWTSGGMSSARACRRRCGQRPYQLRARSSESREPRADPPPATPSTGRRPKASSSACSSRHSLCHRPSCGPSRLTRCRSRS